MQLVRIDAIIQQATFGTHEMNVKIIGLQAIDTRSHLCRIAIGKFEKRNRGRIVFIRLKNIGPRSRSQTGHLLHIAIHKKQTRIQGVTPRGEQTRPGKILLHIPFKLTIPGTNTVIVINLAIVQLAE